MSCCFGVRRPKKRLSNAPENGVQPDKQASKVSIKVNQQDDPQRLSNKSKQSNKRKSSVRESKKKEDDLKEVQVVVKDKGGEERDRERSKDYGNEASEVNATNLKEDPKAMKQIRDLFTPNSILETPTINTFRYDCILAHAIEPNRSGNDSHILE